MIDYRNKFEHIVTAALIVVLTVVFFGALSEPGWTSNQDLLRLPIFILDSKELLEVFVFILLRVT